MTAAAASPRPSRMLLFRLLRVVDVALLLAVGGIHLHLWLHGYRHIHIIGWLFLFNVIASFFLAVATLITHGFQLTIATAVSALFVTGTLLALITSIHVGLFGFQESITAPYVKPALTVEVIAISMLTALTGLTAVSHPSK